MTNTTLEMTQEQTESTIRELNIALLSIIAQTYHSLSWVCYNNSDGEPFENFFIVGIDTPTGQYISEVCVELSFMFTGIKELTKAPNTWDSKYDYQKLYDLLSYSYEELYTEQL